MLYVPNEYDLRLVWTLPLIAKRGGETVEFDEFDVTLCIGYWEEDNRFGWEVQRVCLDGPRPVYIRPEDDEAFWTLISRAVAANFEAINERVQERAADDMAESIYEAEER